MGYIRVQCLMQSFEWVYVLLTLSLKLGIFKLSQVHQYQASHPEWQPISGCYSSACLWALSAASFYWCSLQRKLSHKYMCIQTCIKILQQGLSSWGSLARYTDKMCPSQLRKIFPLNMSHAASLLFQVGWIWVTLQVYYFKLDVDRQISGINSEWPAKSFELSLQLPKNLKALLKLLQ